MADLSIVVHMMVHKAVDLCTSVRLQDGDLDRGSQVVVDLSMPQGTEEGEETEAGVAAAVM